MEGDLELVDEIVHPDFIDHQPAEQPSGPESVKQTVRHPRGCSGASGSLRHEATGREFAVRHIYIWPTTRSSSTGEAATTWASSSSGLLPSGE